MQFTPSYDTLTYMSDLAYTLRQAAKQAALDQHEMRALRRAAQDVLDTYAALPDGTAPGVDMHEAMEQLRETLA